MAVAARRVNAIQHGLVSVVTRRLQLCEPVGATDAFDETKELLAALEQRVSLGSASCARGLPTAATVALPAMLPQKGSIALHKIGTVEAVKEAAIDACGSA